MDQQALDLLAWCAVLGCAIVWTFLVWTVARWAVLCGLGLLLWLGVIE